MASTQSEQEKAAARLLLTVVYANHANMTDVLDDPSIFYDGWSPDGKNILVNGHEISIGALFRAASRLLVRVYSDFESETGVPAEELVSRRLQGKKAV